MKRRSIVAAGFVALMGFSLAGCAPSAPAPGGAAGDVAAGKAVFEANCNVCHPGGEKGVGPALKGTAKTPDQIRTQVRQGKGAMPAFGTEKINDKQLTDLIAYVKSLK